MGSATLEACLERGLLHRAVAVLVERSNGDILLQRRSKKDLWHPGLWTLSCTGHVRQGEGYLDAANRELHEELRLKASLRMEKKLLMPPFTSGSLTEREWVTLFTTTSDQTPTIDPVELEEVEDVSEPRLQRMLKGTRLTPDAKLLLAALGKSPRKSPSVRRSGV